ncbi:MAG TPA: hypothetical protein VIP46_11380 [Pyrinomonadaceae bacterium]
MTDNSESPAIFSPATVRVLRVLWVVGLVAGGMALAFSLWGVARDGWSWTRILVPLGASLFLLLSNPSLLGQGRGRFYAVLSLLAVGLMTTGLILQIAQS